jgi:hypothetical protein
VNRRDALALLIAAGLVTGCAGPADAADPIDVMELVAVPGGWAATSARSGPFRLQDGCASGFSHDVSGAAAAATHIGARVTPAAGPGRMLATGLPLPATPPRPELAPATIWCRKLAGDPTAEQVVVSLLADTEEARAAGGLARVDAALRWSNEDWQLRVPASRPSVHRSSDGYRLLAATGATS